MDHALGAGSTDPACSAAARTTAARLAELGHDVEESHPPELDRMDELGGDIVTLWAVGAKASLVSLEPLLGRPLGPDDVEPGTWALAEWGASTGAVDLTLAQGRMSTLRRELAAWWIDHDLLLTPTTAAPPPRLGELVGTAEDPLRGLVGSAPYATFTSVFNHSGQPAISLPLHRTADGLPVGVQLVAAYGREDLLVAVAAELEEAVGWTDQRPPVHA